MNNKKLFQTFACCSIITIRRFENFRKTGKLGWQNGNALEDDSDLIKL
jgi:hypothetical protein